MSQAAAVELPTDSPAPHRGRVLVLVIAVIMGIGGVMVLFRFNPDATRLFPPCPLRYLTGLYCAGCGTTRAAHHLAHGRIATAWGYNPLMLLMLPYIASGTIAGSLRWARLIGPSRSRRILSPRLIWTLFAVIVLYGVLRNIPHPPFDVLAPHGPAYQ